MKKLKHVVIFSGAGMSADSGISTFRDTGGLWENYKIEEVATPEAWKANAKMVQEFYNLRRKNILSVQPNSAHLLIAQLEKEFQVTVITQNIDDLHERAGSTNIVHLHGNILLAKSSGLKQEEKYSPVTGDLNIEKDFCDDGYPLRPHVVWFGEEVPNYAVAQSIIQTATDFIVIGTSLNVYPAAGLIHYTQDDCRCFLIDPSAATMHVPSYFQVINMSATEGIVQCIEAIKKG